jgi:hypothetical protein
MKNLYQKVSIYLSIYLSNLTLYLSNLTLYLSLSLYINLSIYLSIYLIWLSIYLSIEEDEEINGEDYNINEDIDGKEINVINKDNIKDVNYDNNEDININNHNNIKKFKDFKADAIASLSLIDSDDEEYYSADEGNEKIIIQWNF